jgi:Alginate export
MYAAMPETSCQVRRIATRYRAHATGLLVLALVVATQAQQVAAEDAKSPTASPTARPAIKSDRWQEDWSPLANPALRIEPLDDLKYISLSPTDPKSYISLGLTLRERFESNNAPSFGVGNVRGDSYLLQRLWGHADVRPRENWQLFATLEDVRPFDKRTITPVDENLLDLRHAFLAYVNTTDKGTFKARVGRQDFAFDLQRFVSLRDGPNVRQSFDAIWADWETGPWPLHWLPQPACAISRCHGV